LLSARSFLTQARGLLALLLFCFLCRKKISNSKNRIKINEIRIDHQQETLCNFKISTETRNNEAKKPRRVLPKSKARVRARDRVRVKKNKITLRKIFSCKL